MNNLAKVGLIVGGLWVASKLVAAASKASKIDQNLYVSSDVKDLDPGFISSKIKLEARVKNISGFNLTVKNLFSKVYFIDSAGIRTEVGVTGITKEVRLNNGEETPFPMELTVSNKVLFLIFKTVKIEVVTWYDFAGQQLNYPSEISLEKIRVMIKQKLGLGSVPAINPNSTLCYI